MKNLIFSLCVFLPSLCFAYDAEIDGIYFNILSTKAKTAEVTSEFNNSKSYKGSVDIPASIIFEGEEYSVISIGESAFLNCKNLTSATIPNSVTSIGSSAFQGTGIRTINIPNSITSIGEQGFSSSSLVSITIPNSVTALGKHAFSNCNALRSAIVGDGVKTIENATFYECYAMTSITIGKNVRSFGQHAFYRCTKLDSVLITDIANWCSVNFDPYYGSPFSYARNLFLNGEIIKDLVISENVSTIGNSVFSNCSFSSVTIGNSVTSIGNSAFSNCTEMTSLFIGNNVVIIGSSAFGHCSSLSSVTIPNSVTTIKSSAFNNCSNLVSLTIGKAVTTIEGNAFSSCSELEDVYCLASIVPSAKTNIFENSYIEYSTLHVPVDLISDYKVKKPWMDFKEIVPLEGEIPEISKCATPIIKYFNGKLSFSSETENVKFVTDITDSDIKKHYDTEINLSVTYTINVYATKPGYDDSDIATATLCWVEAEPITEGVENDIAYIKTRPVMIQYIEGAFNVSGLSDGDMVSIYTLDGSKIGQGVFKDGTAQIQTNIKNGSTVIIRFGKQSLKYQIM